MGHGSGPAHRLTDAERLELQHRVRAALPRVLRAALDGSVGDCYDNAMCESFFAMLECELLAGRSLRTQAEARLAVFDFIEGWYNPRRRHSALGYLSPMNFKRAHQEEVAA